MNFEPLEAIANAVLFEGYILYPYRPSAMKNRQRWNFGTLYPRTFAESLTPPERSSFAAEGLMEGNRQTKLTARVRFLQLVSPTKEDGQSWREGFPRTRTLDSLPIAELCEGVDHVFDFAHLSADEIPTGPRGFLERPRRGRLILTVKRLRDGLYRLHAEFSNDSTVPEVTSSRRDVQDAAFTSAHLLLGLENGVFVSLLESPAEFESDVKACKQDGVFPVLAGEAGDRSRMLCPPIILYDYQQVAPESAGDFFDGTEMDEMLALRILTLTDDEKAEMRQGDSYARAILERTETLSNEQMLKVHGAVRGLRRVTASEPAASPGAASPSWDPFAQTPAPERVTVFGIELRKGDRVRLWPQKRADIMDIAMEGKIAIIEAIEQDLEGNIQFAVVLEDDPGRDMGMLRQAGHRFFYSPEEVEPLRLEVP